MTLDIPRRVVHALENPTINRPHSKNGLYPTQASVVDDGGNIHGACHRESYYHWFETQGDGSFNPDWALAATQGDWLHEGIVHFLRHNAIGTGLTVVSQEQSFINRTAKHITSGRSDIIVRDDETGKLYGVEVKTVGEWAGKESIEYPKVAHLLQAAVCLDAFNTNLTGDIEPIEEWIVLYLSRDENWDLKKNPHGSKLQLLWQHTIYIDSTTDVIHCKNQSGLNTAYPFKMKDILDRYDILMDHIINETLPDRDFAIQYDEATIHAKYLTGDIKFKKDTEVVSKWLKKGAVPGDLKLALGDSQCRFCSYANICYSNNPESYSKRSTRLHNLKRAAPAAAPKKTKARF